MELDIDDLKKHMSKGIESIYDIDELNILLHDYRELALTLLKKEQGDN